MIVAAIISAARVQCSCSQAGEECRAAARRRDRGTAGEVFRPSLQPRAALRSSMKIAGRSWDQVGDGARLQDPEARHGPQNFIAVLRLAGSRS